MQPELHSPNHTVTTLLDTKLHLPLTLPQLKLYLSFSHLVVRVPLALHFVVCVLLVLLNGASPELCVCVSVVLQFVVCVSASQFAVQQREARSQVWVSHS